MQQAKQTPQYWQRQTLVTVTDKSEGWKDRSFSDEITREEFLLRASKSKAEWPAQKILEAFVYGNGRF